MMLMVNCWHATKLLQFKDLIQSYIKSGSIVFKQQLSINFRAICMCSQISDIKIP